MISNKKLLNFEFTPHAENTNAPVLVFIHGLFGDLNNLAVIAREFMGKYSVLRLDLRNHGKSFHTEEMNYDRLSEDVILLLDHLNCHKYVLIGHSMGGKTAMKVAAKRPDLVEKLVILDMAPVNYGEHGHREIFSALNAVKEAQVKTRQEAKPYLSAYIDDVSVQQFMLKSFDANMPERTRFHLSALEKNYLTLMDWTPIYVDIPTLFIKGGNSDYILPSYQKAILDQFPKAKAFVIQGCGHWIHAEKPTFVIRAIARFLNENNASEKREN